MRNWSIFFCFLVFAFRLQSQIFISNDKEILSIGKDVFILEDTSNNVTIEEVQKLNAFEKSNSETPNLNISQSTFWVKFEIKNNTQSNFFLLEIAHPTIDIIEFYEISGIVVRHESSSEYELFGTRKYDSPNYIFELNLEENEKKTYLLKIKSGEQVLLPLFIGTEKKIFENGSKHEMIFGIYVGIILIMFLYNLFISFTVKDKSYLLYIIYIFFVGLTQACIKGFAFKYLWPNCPEVAIQSMYWVPALSGISAVLFLINFIRVKEMIPWSLKGFYLILFFYSLSIILSSLGSYFISVQIIQACALFGSLYTLFVAILVARKGYRPAKYFLLGWSVFLSSVICYVLKTFGVIPHNSFTNYILEFGSAIETILLSFALGDRINTYKQERLQAIKEKENILREQNVVLEQQVTERTKKLSQTLDQLRATQSQLVQSEKMASLGQLTAGMAHEINNPLNYMSQGVEILKEDIGDLKSLINKYDEVLAESNEEIEKIKQSIQIEYVYKEIDEALADIQDGIGRTLAISAGLKTFSRVNEASIKPASIHENLESTLQLMKHEFAEKGIEIEKDYHAVQDIIECNSGKLNQVFMNILTNAVYAITHKEGLENGKIIISTKSDEDNFYISMKDNGVGMSEETKNRLFDPFFTTKDVGEGTGLGMSIVHGIIDEHCGKIDVVSELGFGSEIKILLPIKGK